MHDELFPLREKSDISLPVAKDIGYQVGGVIGEVVPSSRDTLRVK